MPIWAQYMLPLPFAFFVWPIVGWYMTQVLLARGLNACARCGYDMSGRARNDPCPECGEAYRDICKQCGYDRPDFGDRVRCPECGVTPLEIERRSRRGNPWRRWWVWLTPAWVGVTVAAVPFFWMFGLAGEILGWVMLAGVPLSCLAVGIDAVRSLDVRNRRTFASWWYGALIFAMAGTAALNAMLSAGGDPLDVARRSIVIALYLGPPASGVGAVIGGAFVWWRVAGD